MTDTQPTAGAGRPVRIGTTVIVGVLAGVIGALVALIGESRLSPPPLSVATVDVRGLVAEEIERLQASGMDPAKAEAYATLWGPLLDKSVQTIADDFGVVLLVSPSVVAGAPDLTPVLKERLDNEVKAFQQ